MWVKEGCVGQMKWVFQDTISWNPTMYMYVWMYNIPLCEWQILCTHYARTNVSQQVLGDTGGTREAWAGNQEVGGATLTSM